MRRFVQALHSLLHEEIKPEPVLFGGKDLSPCVTAEDDMIYNAREMKARFA